MRVFIMRINSAETSNTTKTVSFRLPLDEIEILENIALSNNNSPGNYVKKLVKQNIKAQEENGQNDDKIVVDIALGLATLLQMMAQQEPSVIREIQLKAEPILAKLNKVFNVDTI